MWLDEVLRLSVSLSHTGSARVAQQTPGEPMDSTGEKSQHLLCYLIDSEPPPG
jgi:hypothetical protein